MRKSKFVYKNLVLEIILKLPQIINNFITKHILTKYAIISCIYKDIKVLSKNSQC